MMTQEQKKKINLELFQQEFHARHERIDALPVQIDYETTSRCNLRCFTCTKSYSDEKGKDSSPELFDKVADALFDTAISINLTGYGEPMLSKHSLYISPIDDLEAAKAVFYFQGFANGHNTLWDIHEKTEVSISLLAETASKFEACGLVELVE